MKQVPHWGPKLLGAAVELLFARATGLPGFVHHWCNAQVRTRWYDSTVGGKLAFHTLIMPSTDCAVGHLTALVVLGSYQSPGEPINSRRIIRESNHRVRLTSCGCLTWHCVFEACVCDFQRESPLDQSALSGMLESWCCIIMQAIDGGEQSDTIWLHCVICFINK